MSDRRVVITGIGVVTPLGHTLGATLDAIACGRSAVRPASVFGADGFACSDAAEIRDWDPRPSFRSPKALKLTDRPARFAVAAAQMALDDARFPQDDAGLEALGVVVGQSGSDLQARDMGRALAHDPDGRTADHIPCFADRVLKRLNPLWLLVSLPNMTSAHVAIQVQARGPNSTIMSDWAAGHQAIGEAAEWIRGGEADAVLAGGADSGIQPFAYACFQQAAMFAGRDSAGSRFVPAEGAAMFLLESRDTAIARGAAVYGEVRAYSARAGEDDSFDRALGRSIDDAMTTAAWHAGDVSLCTVAAPSIQPFSDTVSRAVNQTLGERAARRMIDRGLGYALAAAGPIDAALTMAVAPAGSRVLSSAIGCMGEAVTLALEAARRA